MDPCEGISKIFSPISLSSCERGLVLLLGSEQGVKWSSRHLHTIQLTLLTIKLFPYTLKMVHIHLAMKGVRFMEKDKSFLTPSVVFQL